MIYRPGLSPKTSISPTMMNNSPNGALGSVLLINMSPIHILPGDLVTFNLDIWGMELQATSSKQQWKLSLSGKKPFLTQCSYGDGWMTLYSVGCRWFFDGAFGIMGPRSRTRDEADGRKCPLTSSSVLRQCSHQKLLSQPASLDFHPLLRLDTGLL